MMRPSRTIARVGVREPLARSAHRPLPVAAEVEEFAGGPEVVGLPDHEIEESRAADDGALEVVGDAGGVREQPVDRRLLGEVLAVDDEQAAELGGRQQLGDGRLERERARLHELHDEGRGEHLADARDVEPRRLVAEAVVEPVARRAHRHLRSAERTASTGDPRQVAVEFRGEPIVIEVRGRRHLRESLHRVSKRDVSTSDITSRSIRHIRDVPQGMVVDGEANAWET